ncbi:hypothetical protein [Sinomonas sp.]|uniref:hypothetical protein n=1 Tax=Sinomonas sp. TaxID=1914986 RepID=UPI003F80717A
MSNAVAISVFDLTDELLDQLAPARPICWDPFPWPVKPRRKPEAKLRRCSGCGIDTAEPDLCYDCEESGWFR